MTTRGHLPIDTLSRSVAHTPAHIDRCSLLWLDLVSGKLEIVQASTEPGRCILILRARAEPARPLGARAQEVLERTLLGERRKVTAYEMGFSVSMLALTLKASLVSLGLNCKPSQVSAALVMLVHGARGAIPPKSTFIGDYDHDNERFTAVTHVFDESVLCGLSPSQRAVMIMVANGRSCAHIAARRNRSDRTVINQIASATRRLGISGRFELLRCFATGAAPRRRAIREALAATTLYYSSLSPEGGAENAALCG